MIEQNIQSKRHDKEPIDTITRREFLYGLGALLLGSSFKSETNSTNSKSTWFTKLRNWFSGREKQLVRKRSETISGLEVFGTKKPLSKNDLTALTLEINQQFLKEHPELPTNIGENAIRAELLSKEKRYLELVIKKSLFDTFKTNHPDNIDLLEWIKIHIQIMNDIIENSPFKTNLRTRLGNVYIVEDDLANELGQTYRNGSTLGGDATWTFVNDVRGYVASNGENTQAAYLDLYTLPNGKSITIDTGFIHELWHALYSVEDEYTFNVSEHAYSPPHLPQLLIAEGGANTLVSRWFYAALQRTSQLNIRGYYSDNRSPGVAGQSSSFDGESSYDVVGEHPKQNKFYITDFHGRPINGTITILNNTNSDYTPYSPKNFDVVSTGIIENGEYILEEKVFEPLLNGTNYMHRSNFVFQIVTDTKEQHIIHIPVNIFNIAAISEIESANFELQLLDDSDHVQDSSYLQIQKMGMFTEREKTLGSPLARIIETNTGDEYNWISAPITSNYDARALFGYDFSTN